MKRIYLLLLLAAITFSAQSQNFTVRTVKSNLFIPWEIIYGPGDSIWFTQKNGFICRLDAVSGHTDTLYHETNNVIQSEGGMLGLALHPSFPDTPYVYAAYQYNQGGYKERIVRYTYFYQGDTLGSPLTLLDNITGANFHNGCRLLIVNGKLFITTGDAGNTATAQTLSSLNGKVLRINLDGSIPNDNPIPGNPAWSWGDRNSQGMVYANGRLYTSMHGDSNDDEVNIIEGGRNYGWPNVEGYCDGSELTFCNDSNVAEPIYAWTPTIAPAGLDYYDHPMFPQWQNALIMCTLKDTSLYIMKLNGTHDSIIAAIRIDTLHIGRIRDICISPNGSIFLSTSMSPASGNGNKIDRIVELYDSSFVPAGVPVAVKNNALRVYPNPARQEVTVSLHNATATGLSYRLLNVTGQVAKQGKMEKGTISITELPAGMYHLLLTDTKGAVFTAKILKE